MRRGASDKARRPETVSDKALDRAMAPPEPELDRCRHGKSAREDCPVCDLGEAEPSL